MARLTIIIHEDEARNETPNPQPHGGVFNLHAVGGRVGYRVRVAETEGVDELVRTYVDCRTIHSRTNGVVAEKLVNLNALVLLQSFGGARGPSTALMAEADPKDLQIDVERGRLSLLG